MKAIRSAYSRETRATSGASPWHISHHGAQNQIATSCPANDVPSTDPPPSCGAVKSRTSDEVPVDPGAAVPADPVSDPDEHATATTANTIEWVISPRILTLQG
jgi:hypothetical protein